MALLRLYVGHGAIEVVSTACTVVAVVLWHESSNFVGVDWWMEKGGKREKVKRKKKILLSRRYRFFFCTECARPFGRLADAKGLSPSVRWWCLRSIQYESGHLFWGPCSKNCRPKLPPHQPLVAPLTFSSSIIQMIGGVVAFAKARKMGWGLSGSRRRTTFERRLLRRRDGKWKRAAFWKWNSLISCYSPVSYVALVVAKVDPSWSFCFFLLFFWSPFITLVVHAADFATCCRLNGF